MFVFIIFFKKKELKVWIKSKRLFLKITNIIWKTTEFPEMENVILKMKTKTMNLKELF